MNFTPIKQDMPISYADEHSNVFHNKARSEAWGGKVYFFPPNYSINQYGCGGYHYQYGYPYDVNRGYKGNCTYWVGCRHLLNSGEILTCVIDSAKNVFKNYKGRKTGGSFNNQYIGDSIQKGDILVFADNLQMTGDGHVVYVEDVSSDTLYISESAYSQKSIYEGKACITYTLNKANMICGKGITLRPKLPYTEYLIGVIHTGDVYDKEEKKDYEGLYLEQLDKMEQIKKYVSNIENELKKIKGIF